MVRRETRNGLTDLLRKTPGRQPEQLVLVVIESSDAVLTALLGDEGDRSLRIGSLDCVGEGAPFLSDPLLDGELHG
jgi:hypothetical protein